MQSWMLFIKGYVHQEEEDNDEGGYKNPVDIDPAAVLSVIHQKNIMEFNHTPENNLNKNRIKMQYKYSQACYYYFLQNIPTITIVLQFFITFDLTYILYLL